MAISTRFKNVKKNAKQLIPVNNIWEHVTALQCVAWIHIFCKKSVGKRRTGFLSKPLPEEPRFTGMCWLWCHEYHHRLGYWGNIGEILGKYLAWEIFVFFVCVEVLCIQDTPSAQHGTGEEEDNQDLLPWESLPVLIEQLLYFMNRLTFQLNNYSVFISSSSKYLLNGNEDFY